MATDEELREIGLYVVETMAMHLADVPGYAPLVLTLQAFDHRRVIEVFTPGLPVKRLVVRGGL